MAILFFVIGILLFVGLVVAHEFGHYIMARRNGVEVEEFGIGFPPRAKVLKVVKGTEYTLNWLPLGGFVKLKGESDDDRRKGSFGAASLKTKLKIMVAGVVMNLIAAFVLFTVIAAFGMPKSNLQDLPFYDQEQFTVASDTHIVKSQTLVSFVAEDSPAARAGLEFNDQIVSLAGEPIDNGEELKNFVAERAGESIEVVYNRGDDINKMTVATLNTERTDTQGFIGIGTSDSIIFRSTWSAPIVGAATTAQYVDVSFRGLGYVISSLFRGDTNQATEAVGGPVATFKILSDSSSLGIIYVLFVIALISVSLAVMNILPIPALDGGRVFVTLLFRAMRRPLTKDTEERIHGSGFVALMVLILLITVVDVKRFF